MADKIRILNWNVAGAKYLETKDEKEREKFKMDVNNALRSYIDTLAMNNRIPHVITLQEIVQYRKPEPNEKLIDFIDESKFPEYCYMPFPLIDTDRHAYTSKWKKIAKIWGNDKIYFAQGNAILAKKDLPLLPVWSLARSSRAESKVVSDEKLKCNHLVENVIIRSGIYFGNRNTEPRSALVSHFVFDRSDGKEFLDDLTGLPKPQDVFVINMHLTTLMYEREGIPQIDDKAVEIRIEQLDIVFNEIISTYNEWARSGFLTRGEIPELKTDETTSRFNPLWILCGDLNFTPESDEYDYIRRRNFVDTIPQKGRGTKAKGPGKEASLTLDYIFAGPKFLSLDDNLGDQCWGNINPEILCSDHRPMFSCIPLAYK
jgi:hypothetical protein